MLKFIDIGANLTDPMYSGVYRQRQRHEADLPHVLARAWTVGVDKIIVTGGSLHDSSRALQIARQSDRLYSTVGVHPTRCDEFLGEISSSPDAHLQSLCTLVECARDKVVAVGECGLDYDRLHFCDKSVQLRFFELQLQLARRCCLPLFVHCRSSCADVLRLLQQHGPTCARAGVVHSFDGTAQEADALLALGYDIGINGCSLKTADNLRVVAGIPSDRLHLETDSPWCEVRPSHAGYPHVVAAGACDTTAKKPDRWTSECAVKSRNEPANIRQVLHIVAAVKNQHAQTLAQQIYNNSMRMFFPDQDQLTASST